MAFKLKKGKKRDVSDRFYRLDEILKYNADYNIIFGERGPGKTFACLEYALKRFWETGEQFGYLRRWQEDYKTVPPSQLFSAIIAEGLVDKITDGEYTGIKFYNKQFFLTKWDEEGQKDIISPNPMGFIFSISTMEHAKSVSFPNITTLIFDEFISKQAYIYEEFSLFANVVSTIKRRRNNFKIFMLGNTISKVNPYFTEMGLTNAKNMKPGQIDLYDYGDSGLRCAVEFTEIKKTDEDKRADRFFAFDSPKLQMITGQGDVWELDIYPHIPCKYRPMDIKFVYFIEFDGELFQCNVIKKDSNVFTYIHRKTTDIKDEEKDIVFSTKYDVRKNWRIDITRPYDKLGQNIYKFFKEDNVYYQDNAVGDIVHHYLDWCISRKK